MLCLNLKSPKAQVAVFGGDNNLPLSRHLNFDGLPRPDCGTILFAWKVEAVMWNGRDWSSLGWVGYHDQSAVAPEA